MGLTASQKQALIDNLQLEVTERARKLRAQYALQAQSLRTRIEMRINRIPSGLRKMKMGELYEKYMQMDAAARSQGASEASQKHVIREKDEVAAPILSEQNTINPVSRNNKAHKAETSTTAHVSRGIKRTSETFESDKENPAAKTIEPKPIPNKKQRTTTKESAHPARHNPHPSTVLSPKSANSRTLPSYNPNGGDTLPKNQYSTRPTSPLKGQSSPAKSKATTTIAGGRGVNKSATTNATAKSMGPPPPPQAGKGRGRKAAAAPAPVEIRDEGSIRTVSSASNASTGTTIVKKAAGDSGKRAGTKVGKTTTRGKKTAATPVAAGTVAGEEKTGTKGGRRVLRKR